MTQQALHPPQDFGKYWKHASQTSYLKFGNLWLTTSLLQHTRVRTAMKCNANHRCAWLQLILSRNLDNIMWSIITFLTHSTSDHSNNEASSKQQMGRYLMELSHLSCGQGLRPLYWQPCPLYQQYQIVSALDSKPDNRHICCGFEYARSWTQGPFQPFWLIKVTHIAHMSHQLAFIVISTWPWLLFCLSGSGWQAGQTCSSAWCLMPRSLLGLTRYIHLLLP